MKTNYTALDISSFFIKKSISPLKLQKLLYYSQVWFFVKNEQTIFNDKIKAWIYGPVVYDVWSAFKYMKRSSTIPIKRASNPVFEDSIIIHLENIWTSYGHLSGADLVDLTHNELPWKNSRKGLLKDDPSDNEVIIDKHTTANFFLDSQNKIPFVNKRNSLGHYSNF